MIIGYTTGAYDLFHIGHLNLLRRAKSLCDKLIVGITTDEWMLESKGYKSIIPFWDRLEIVGNIKFVDTVIIEKDMDKLSMWKKIKFDILFVGDDWYNTAKWKKHEKEFKTVGVKIMYLPYTARISTSIIKKALK